MMILFYAAVLLYLSSVFAIDADRHFERQHDFTHKSRCLSVPFVSRDAVAVSGENGDGWPAQCSQDEIIDRIFESQRGLFYIDLAANHHFLISNTHALDKYRNWKGVCIEANPKYWYGLLRNRSCKVFGAAVTSPEDSHKLVNFTFDPIGAHTDHGALSGLVGPEFDNKNVNGGSQFVVPSIGLSELLRIADAPKEIEYLSLDIEGAEEYVLKNFDFNSFVFLTITVERPSDALKHILRQNGYIFVASLAFFDDELWIHWSIREKAQMAKRALAQRTRKCGV